MGWRGLPTPCDLTTISAPGGRGGERPREQKADESRRNGYQSRLLESNPSNYSRGWITAQLRYSAHMELGTRGERYQPISVASRPLPNYRRVQRIGRGLPQFPISA